MSSQHIKPPTLGDIREAASNEGLDLEADEAITLREPVQSLVEIIDELMAIPEAVGRATLPVGRLAGDRPAHDQDPFNVFIRVCDVRGRLDGPLGGRRVGVKDNIDVAGVPTSNASATKPYTPTADAVVIERILAAGGRIVGKLNMDDYAFGATGETSAFGPPLNPLDTSRSPGGSSGGSGAALRSGAVDLALGGDQGGSARIPASYCGVVALKATHGLIPSHGMTHLGHSVDYICPMARTVSEVALLTSVIAGDDWRDPQWVRGVIVKGDYRSIDGADLAGVRVGIVREALENQYTEPAVRQNLERSAEVLRSHGAAVDVIDVPLWTHGAKLTQSLVCHLTGAMVRSEGEGRDHLGLLNHERMTAFAHKRREQSGLFPVYLKVWLIADRYLQDRYLGLPYGVLHNLRLKLRNDIDQALSVNNLLMMPTTPTTAPKLLKPGAEPDEIVERVLGSSPFNTAPLNLSGHPALAVPNGEDASGMPTSVQIVGRRFDEAAVLQTGRIIEQAL